MRTLTTVVLCLVTLAFAGCSRKDAQLTQIDGSEPQRLSFGAPQAVKAAFVEKMQACWFSGSYPVLGGYQFDANPAVIEASDGAPEVQQIAIYSGKGQDAQVFYVQFNPFNENTLISTRNKSLPPELAVRLRRDVETWIFGRNDCGSGAGQDSLSPQNAVRPLQPGEQAQPRIQQVSAPEAAGNANGGAAVSPSQAALVKGVAN